MTDIQNTKRDGFGLHLMLDAYKCNSDKLNDGEFVYRLLDDLTERIDMTQLTKPYVVYAKGNGDHDGGGWSGFVMIEESHISIHTFPERGFVTADVYSCKEFDTEKTIEYFKSTLESDDIETFLQKRGNRY